MNKFQEYHLEIDEKNKKIIVNYLDEIKKFISENNLEGELYYDIEERLFEKLSGENHLNQLKVKQIINEIGNPEDIFEGEPASHKNIVLFMKNTKNKGMQALKSIFDSGINGENILIFLKLLLIKCIVFIKDILKYVLNIGGILLKYTFRFLIKLYKKILFILKKMFYFFGSFIGYIFLGIGIVGLFMVPIFYSGITIGNIDYTGFIPYQLMLGYLFILLAWIGCGTYFILKKRFLLHFIIVGVSLVFSASFGFLGGIKLYENNIYIGKHLQKYELQVPGDYINIFSGNMNLYGNTYLLNFLEQEYHIQAGISPDDKMYIELETEIYAKDYETFQSFEKKLNDMNINLEGEHLTFKLKNGQLFQENTVFTPLKRTMTIFIPENKVFHFNGFYFGQLWPLNNVCSEKYYYNSELFIGNISGSIKCLDKKN